jgi:hypothetical protein
MRRCVAISRGAEFIPTPSQQLVGKATTTVTEMGEKPTGLRSTSRHRVPEPAAYLTTWDARNVDQEHLPGGPSPGQRSSP